MRRYKFFSIAILIIFLLVCSLCVFYAKYSTNQKKILGTKTVIVGGGDTFWSIAGREFPNMNRQEAVYYIRELNPDLDPGRLRRGQEIEVPVFEEVGCNEIFGEVEEG